MVLLSWPLKGIMLLAKASSYWMMWHVWGQSCPSWTVPTATGGSMTAPMLRIWESAVPQKATRSWMAVWVTHLALALNNGEVSPSGLFPWKLWQMWEFSLGCFNKGSAFWGGMSPGWIGAQPQIRSSTRPTIRSTDKWKPERVVLAVSETKLRGWGTVAALLCHCSREPFN